MKLNSGEIISLIANINGLYNNLVAYTVGIMLFAGALIPGIISFFLNRQIKIEQETTIKRLMAELEGAKRELADSLVEKVNAEFEVVEKKILRRMAGLETKFNEKIAVAEGGQYHIQGNVNLKQEFYSEAADDFASAARYYINGRDELNLQSVLEGLNEDCLHKMNRSDFEEDVGLENKIRNLLTTLGEFSENGRYYNIAKKITQSLNIAIKREK
jgi:hypothetical protein